MMNFVEHAMIQEEIRLDLEDQVMETREQLEKKDETIAQLNQQIGNLQHKADILKKMFLYQQEKSKKQLSTLEDKKVYRFLIVGFFFAIGIGIGIMLNA
mgnify:CR=1 FL=1